jgi:N-acetylmuramoyl-L-alanine amidase
MKKIMIFLPLAVSFFFFSAFETKLSSELNTNNYAIFGEKYAATPILTNKMNGHVYYIISGHGGPDPGAVANVNGKMISEDEYAYDVSLRLARNLISYGAKVYMIVRDENDGIRDEEILEMDKDEVVWGGDAIPLNQSQRLKQRTTLINKLYAENLKKGYRTQRVIETHIDSRYSDHKVDVFFYFNHRKPESEVLANNLYETLKSKYDEKQKGRGYEGKVSPRDLWTVKQSEPPVVYVELGNITNEFDRKRLLIPDNRQAIANWFALGLSKE